MSPTNENKVFTPENIEGEILSGCKILHKIAIGGMGTIYKARQLSMNRDVAVKVLSEELSKDRAYVQRFILEARAAGELSHTNLIHVIDVGTYHNLYYYVMEYVDGEGLDAVLEKRGNLPPGESVEIVLQVGSALDHAHKKGIIHRDIKPDNIILMANGQIKLADLGIAKRITTEQEGITQPGMVLGTPFYMAPEQGKDSRLVDRRSDIYALGASFYHMLSGQVPFDGKTCLEVVLKAIEARPTPLLRIKENLPPRVVAICEKMMQKEPDDRYQTSQEVIQDLERVKAGLDPLIAPMPALTARAAMPRSVSPPTPADPPARKPAPAPAPAKEEIFEVEDLDLGESAARTPSTRTPSPAKAAPPPAAEKRTADKPKPAPAPKPAASSGGDLFEIEDLAVPEQKVEKEEAPAPERSKQRQLRDLDPDAVPKRRARPGHGSGTGPAVPSPDEESSTDDDPPSRQQVMTAFSSHGSINPAARAQRTEGERVREKLIPAITLGAGILLFAFGGVWLLRADRSAGKAEKDPLSKHADPVDPGNTATANLADSPESRLALDNADLAAQQHPNDFVRNIAEYTEVIHSYPATTAAVTAKQRIEEMQRRLDDSAKEAFAKIETMVEPARTQHAYGPLLEALRGFREAHGSKEWLDKAAAIEKKTGEEAKVFFDEVMHQADALESSGDGNEAVVQLGNLIDLGVPDLPSQASKRLNSLSDRIRKMSEDARQIFADKYLASESVKENAAKRRFQVIESQLDSYLKDPAMRPLRYTIESELEPVRNARKLMDGFAKSIEISVGKQESIKLVKSVRKGELAGYEDEKILFKVGNGKVGAPLADVLHEEIIRIALISLGAHRPESHILIAGYYQTLGMLDDAEKEIQAAASMGGDIRLARNSLEEARIRERVAAGAVEVDLTAGDFGRWKLSQKFTFDRDANGLVCTQGKESAVLDAVPWNDYIWSMRAKKVSGLNGFLIYFKIQGQFCTWALGDEQNKASWVRGFPETKTADKVANNRWYDLRIVVIGRRAYGYVDGARKWRIEVTESSTADGETPGMGVGCAFCNLTYADPKFTNLQKE